MKSNTFSPKELDALVAITYNRLEEFNRANLTFDVCIDHDRHMIEAVSRQ